MGHKREKYISRYQVALSNAFVLVFVFALLNDFSLSTCHDIMRHSFFSSVWPLYDRCITIPLLFAERFVQNAAAHTITSRETLFIQPCVNPFAFIEWAVHVIRFHSRRFEHDRIWFVHDLCGSNETLGVNIILELVLYEPSILNGVFAKIIEIVQSL